MKALNIARGANLEIALWIARRLGCSVAPVRRTGEVRISHPRMGAPITINGRRHDSPRALTVFLRRLARDIA